MTLENIADIDLLALIGRDVPLKWQARVDGGEYAGPCPFCGGCDRFRVWPQATKPAFWCRGCNEKGDAVDYVRKQQHMGYVEACDLLGLQRDAYVAGTRPTAAVGAPPEPCEPPPLVWQQRAAAYLQTCHAALWGVEGGKARDWLDKRGLGAAAVMGAYLGYNPADRYEPAEAWGLSADRADVWLPRGVVIPWFGEDEISIWRINVRRPVSAQQVASGEKKMIQIPGGRNGLYNVETLGAGLPVVLVEGEMNALTIHQDAEDIAAVVGTGATTWARELPWIVRLAAAPVVLVGFDNDDDANKGEKAAGYWLDALGSAAVRWRPYLKDTNEMLQAGMDIAQWVEAGLQHARSGR